MPKLNTASGTHLVQYAALCWREKGPDIEILLITSRETGRWVIPKGWPMEGRTMAEAAAREAWEEAGVRGLPHPVPVGRYFYHKVELGTAKIEVVVFSLRTDKASKSFPERKQRKRRWLSAADAAALVAEADLADLIKGFA